MPAPGCAPARASGGQTSLPAICSWRAAACLALLLAAILCHNWAAQPCVPPAALAGAPDAVSPYLPLQPASVLAAFPAVADAQAFEALLPARHGFVPKQGMLDMMAWHTNFTEKREADFEQWVLEMMPNSLDAAPRLQQLQQRMRDAPPEERYRCVAAMHPPVASRSCSVFVNHRYKYMYVRLAKSASSSILQRLGDCKDKKNPSRNASYCGTLGLGGGSYEALSQTWRDYFVFTFVRNPWARGYSLAKYMYSEDIVRSRNQQRPECGLDWASFCVNPWIAVARLSSRHCTYRSFRSNMWHAFDQTHCMITESGLGWSVDFIGRVEQLEEDWQQVVSEINRRRPPDAPPVPDGPLQAVNVKRGRISQPYAPPYSHCLDAVTRWYACDVERLGYTAYPGPPLAGVWGGSNRSANARGAEGAPRA